MHVQSVDRALAILELLSNENREMSLTEIAAKMKWPKSTTYDLLVTLRDNQFVDQAPLNGRYFLGVKLFELGNQLARSWNIRTIALPFMKALSAQFGETIQLAKEDNGEVLYLEKLESNRLIRIASEVGSRLPIHCTGLGKILLAHKSSEEVKWILNSHGMQSFTARTITTIAAMEKELGKIRQQGYAEDIGEFMNDLNCIAVAIMDNSGQSIYALSVSGIISSMIGDRKIKLVNALKKAASEISFSVGYRQ